MNNYQSIYTQNLAGGQSFVVDPSYGFTRIEVVAGKPDQIFTLIGNLFLTSNENQNRPSEDVLCKTPYIITSSGNTPLGAISILAQTKITIIGYR